MALTVKICGINTAEAADAAARAGADLAGLVFHRKSPRFVEGEQARALADRLRGRLQLVALLADADDETIAAAIKTAKPNYLQLHGGETPERVGALRTRFGLPIVKAIAVADEADIGTAAAFEAAADMLLFDAKAPEGAARPGGHGASFDWQMLRGRRFMRPWLLAGGLNADNVARAVAASEAPGVDVSSGVEISPGVKSPESIAQFVSAARNAQFAQVAS